MSVHRHWIACAARAGRGRRASLADADRFLLTNMLRPDVVDPATFTEPAVHESQHLALGERIEPFVCAAEL